ncbi:MAG: hypothetical protein J2P18_14950 [Nocardia sp.]|nr:hypothetical protein [Nocardia sp.]
MGTTTIRPGRHRLGAKGTVHCMRIPAIATAVAGRRRSRLSALINLNPARHSLAAIRARSLTGGWVPAAAG